MKLIDYMRRKGIDDEAMAKLIGDCTAHAVKKWKYGERKPDPDRILKIRSITSGCVDLRDWATEQAA